VILTALSPPARLLRRSSSASRRSTSHDLRATGASPLSGTAASTQASAGCGSGDVTSSSTPPSAPW
jgi:hypothetical protein